MALGFAGKIVAASMLGLDFTVMENEQRVIIVGRDLDLEAQDFVLVFMWMYANDWETLSNIVDEREEGLKGAVGAVGAISAAFEEKVVERIANGIQG